MPIGWGVGVGGTGVSVGIIIIVVGVGREVEVKVGVAVGACKKARAPAPRESGGKAEMTVAGALIPQSQTKSRNTLTRRNLAPPLRKANQAAVFPRPRRRPVLSKVEGVGPGNSRGVCLTLALTVHAAAVAGTTFLPGLGLGLSPAWAGATLAPAVTSANSPARCSSARFSRWLSTRPRVTAKVGYLRTNSSKSGWYRARR